MAIGLGTFFLLFISTSALIGFGVTQDCQQAQKKYEGSCVKALSAMLGDEQNNFRDRNNATWALGQLGDSRALPILQKYYTGQIPQREPYDQMISQHELKKAIYQCQGGFNITAYVWRNSLVLE